MKNHNGDIKGYYWLGKSWYNEANLKNVKYIDKFTIGFYCKDGGTSGEISVRWYDLDEKKPAARIECFEDAFHTLYEFKDLLKMLAEKDGENIQPEELKIILDKLGFEDLTQYERE